MFTRVRVATKLLVGFLFVSLLGAAVAGIGILNMGKINDMADVMYERELLGVSYLKEANIDLVYIGRAVRSVMLAANAADRDKYAEAVAKARQELKANVDKARPLFVTEDGKRAFAELDRAVTEYEALIPEVLKMAQAEQLQANRDSVQYLVATVNPKAQAADDKFHELSKVKEKAAADASVETTRLYKESRTLMLILVVASTLAGLALGILITRSLTRQLGGEPGDASGIAAAIAKGDLSVQIETRKNDRASLMFAMSEMRDNLVGIVGKVRTGTDTIATASSQIASGNQDLSQRTEEQASSLEETAASMEELTGTVKQNAENAQQANQLAQSASEVAMKGGTVVNQVVETMSSINDSSRKIVDIITVIDGIAFQTNILALNAAVEAARAGEQGRGFAVVASEVRSLAQRSAAAAKEIKGLIDDSVSKVDTGSELVGKAGQTMQEIVGSIRRVTDIMGEIAAASQEQTRGIEQVNQAITQMDQVTQQNAALVEEASAAAQSMQEQANNLVDAVSVFKLSGHAQAVNIIAKVQELPTMQAAALPRPASPPALSQALDHAAPSTVGVRDPAVSVAVAIEPLA